MSNIPDISQEEKHRMESAMKYLAIEAGANPFDPMELLLLARSIEYAGLHLWKENPGTLEEKMNKEVFTVKAYHYFKRKHVNAIEDFELIKQIQDREYYEVAIIKARYMLCNINQQPNHE